MKIKRRGWRGVGKKRFEREERERRERSLHRWNRFESSEKASEVIDTEESNTLKWRRVTVGNGNAQKLLSSVRLSLSESADHATSGVASDLVRWCSGWWWEQPKQHT